MTRILLVDDHPIFREGIKSLINDLENYSIVAEAANGHAALKIIEKETIDLLITDIHMPELNGIELTKMIRTKYPHIKVIVLTMDSGPNIIQTVAEIDAHALITKTNNLAKLRELLDNVINNESTFQLSISSTKTEETNSLSEKLSNITKREKEILAFIATGMTDKQIALLIHLSPYTVITHRKNLLSKLGLNNKMELTRFAIENNIGH